MALYWSLASVPELADLPRGERRRFVRDCPYSPLAHWQTWVGIAAFVLCSGGAGLLAAPLPRAEGIAVCCIGAGIGAFVFGQLHISVLRPYLRAARDRMGRGRHEGAAVA